MLYSILSMIVLYLLTYFLYMLMFNLVYDCIHCLDISYFYIYEVYLSYVSMYDGCLFSSISAEIFETYNLSFIVLLNSHDVMSHYLCLYGLE